MGEIVASSWLIYLNAWSLTAFPPYSFMSCIGTAVYLYLDIEVDV
jgi:hypothetical protein